jgi:lipopolysaccharide export LptBFGC system permease protein LptF
MNSKIGSLKSNMSDKVIDSDYTELENFKKNIQKKIDENKTYINSNDLTQDDKIKLQEEINNLNKSLNEIDSLLSQIEKLKKENNQITKFNMKLFLVIFVLLLLVLIFLLWYLKLKNKKNPQEFLLDNFKILQIIKN